MRDGRFLLRGNSAMPRVDESDAIAIAGIEFVRGGEDDNEPPFGDDLRIGRVRRSP